MHAFPPRSTAGVEVYTLRLAKALQALGHTVLVLSASHDLAAEPGRVRRRTHEGIDVAEVVNVHHRGTLAATYEDPDVDAAAAAVIDGFRPDVVHLQHLLNLSTGVVAEAKRRGARVLLTLHDYWLGCPRDGQRMRADLALCTTIDHAVCAGCLADSPYLVPTLQRGLAAAARQVGAGRHLHRIHDLLPGPTEAVLRLLRRRAAAAGADTLAAGMDSRAAHLRRALTGVDLLLAPTAFARARALEFLAGTRDPATVRHLTLGAVDGPAQPRRAGPRLRFGYIGTLAPHKGLHVLLDAFRQLDHPEASLDVFGNPAIQPAYVARLQQSAASDSRIRFGGGFPEGGQAQALAAIDVLVIPSLWWENSPLTALEALCAGLPVIASRTGGVPELIADGDTGVLVTPGDVRELTGALADVASGTRLASSRAPVAQKTTDAGARELALLYESLR